MERPTQKGRKNKPAKGTQNKKSCRNRDFRLATSESDQSPKNSILAGSSHFKKGMRCHLISGYSFRIPRPGGIYDWDPIPSFSKFEFCMMGLLWFACFPVGVRLAVTWDATTEVSGWVTVSAQ